MIYIEKTYNNVTPKQAAYFIKRAIRKIAPDRIMPVDVNEVINSKNNIRKYIEVIDGKRL